MCGIVGQIGPAACNREQILKMMGMLGHRGPDEAGVLLANGLAFGHLRLSIVDLQHGQQPMSTHDGRYWVTFNGEIFNHIELRKQLEDAGHVFRTRCDTEVLLNAFREWGQTAWTGSTASGRSRCGIGRRETPSSPEIGSACVPSSTMSFRTARR